MFLKPPRIICPGVCGLECLNAPWRFISFAKRLDTSRLCVIKKGKKRKFRLTPQKTKTIPQNDSFTKFKIKQVLKIAFSTCSLH